MTMPDQPELRRVEPTGNPRVDVLISAMVCPSCRTIYNAAKAKCDDPWHSDNQAADGEQLTWAEAAQLAQADADEMDRRRTALTDREAEVYATGGTVPADTLRVAADGCTMPPGVVDLNDLHKVKFAERIKAAMATQRITVLPPTESEREQAAYERGVAEGLRRAVQHVAHLLGTRVDYDPDPAEAEVMLALAIDDALAEGRRQATDGWTRRWSVRDQQGRVSKSGFTEAGAKARAAETGGTFVTRLVGPWEDVEQRKAPPGHEGCDLDRTCSGGPYACLQGAEQAGGDRG